MQSLTTAPEANRAAISHLRSTTLRFCEGQLIFDEGQSATRWFEVVHGTVRTCRFHTDGNRHLTGFFFSGDIFGTDHGLYGTAAEAVTDVELRCFRVGNIARPDTPKHELDEAVSILIRAMSTAQRYQFIIGHRTALEKVAAFLLCLRQQASGDRQIKIPMSRSDIADFLGLTIHTVSRTFSDLARRGLIEVDGRNSVVATDPDGLCRLARDYPADPAAGSEADRDARAQLGLGKMLARQKSYA